MRIGYNRTVDLSISALLEAQNSVQHKNRTSRAKSMHNYVEAIDSLRSLLSTNSFQKSEYAMVAVAILSAYESTHGASLQSMYVSN